MAKTRLAEIYEMEKARGGGLASTFGKRAIEKIDPRQIFNQEGLLAAAFPSLFKAYKVKNNKSDVKSGSKISDSGFNSLSIESKLDSLISDSQVIRTNSNLIAKSALVLPKIQQDTNLTRQNIARLVKLLGGEATYKPDMFFKKASEREKEYESKYGKEKSKVDKQKISEDEKSKLKREETSSITSLITATRDAASGLNLLKTALSPLIGPAGLLAGLGVAALYAIDKMSDKLKERAKEEGGEEGVALEEKVQGETLLGAMDPMGTSFVTGESIAGEKLTSTDDQLAQRRKYQAEESAKKWRDWSMKSKAREGAAEKAREVNLSPVAAGAIVEPFSPTFASETAGWKKFGMGPDVAAMKHEQIGAMSPKPTGISEAFPKSPTQKNPLLDLIAKHESESAGGYNAMNQGTPKGGNVIGSGNSEKVIGQKLTDMTIGQILAKAAKPGDSAEKRKKEGLIFAAGRYQIIPETLKTLVSKGVVSEQDRFNEETQDRLAMSLLEARGLSKYQKGQMSAEAFQNSLAKEWASLPTTAGVSAYHKPGQNVAGKGAGQELKAAIASVAPTGGGKLASATQDVSAAKTQIAQAPVIINSPTTNNVSGAGAAKPSSSQASSTYDKELAGALVGRAT